MKYVGSMKLPNMRQLQKTRSTSPSTESLHTLCFGTLDPGGLKYVNKPQTRSMVTRLRPMYILHCTATCSSFCVRRAGS